MSDLQLLNKIKEAMVKLDKESTDNAVKEALAQGVTPQDIILHGPQEAMKLIGDKFASREYFLPELIMSADLMKGVSETLQPYLDKQKTAAATGKIVKVVLGSAKDDIHDIGKNIVGLVLSANGFEVYDVGIDVSQETFASKAKEVGADVVAISALLSTVVSKVRETISYFQEIDCPVKFIVGGAAFTRESAKMIGANGYAKDAWSAVEEIRSIMGETVKGRVQ